MNKLILYNLRRVPMMASDLTDSMMSCQKKALWNAAYNHDFWWQNTESVLIFLTGYTDMRNNAENKSLTVV